MSNPTEEQVISNFEKAQQFLIDGFKEKMKKEADRVISDLYCDLSPHAYGDAHMNFREMLKREFRDELIGLVINNHGHHSWAAEIRMELLKRHPETLQNKIISDLQKKVRDLEHEYDNLLAARRSSW